MNNLLNISTPAQSEARSVQSDYGLENHGLSHLRAAYWNLPIEALYEEIAFRKEGRISKGGAMVVSTGKHTSRAAADKFIVREPDTEKQIWWGEYNRPMAAEKFNDLFNRMQGFLQGRDVFVQDCYAGADPNYRLPIRVITELAWHSVFARNMFILPATHEEARRHVPEFTLLCLPSFKGIQTIDGTTSNTFIALNYAQRLGIIGNTGYAGEIKKTVFTVLNFLLPQSAVMPMHCSANVGPKGDPAVFFGLSGTGKTTLSADPSRGLIGDDEHGWSEEGVFNFEGGCYAKVIRLSPSAEPQIYSTTHSFGTILENVVADPVSRLIDLDDERNTENTRASYSLDAIANAVPSRMAGHPSNIVFLTCDASGVMPPISRLTPDQAMYQFISGYTSKIAGTEAGLGKEPEMTFSTCFGAPFMVHPPHVYADLLKRKIERYGSHCWLVNTGWSGGPYGVGKRISIAHTRALLNAALDGSLLKVKYRTDPVFGFQVPLTCDGVPSNILNPADTWPSTDAHAKKYRQLATRFVENFRKYSDGASAEVIAAGPKI